MPAQENRLFSLTHRRTAHSDFDPTGKVKRTISLSVSDFVKESICKITFIGENKTGTGFFMNISDTLKCLITNYHVINPYAKLENIEIEIHNYLL